MAFNFFELHDANEDKNKRQLIRVYSVLPKFDSTAIALQSEQAVMINALLKFVNNNLNKQISFAWKNIWLNSMGYAFAKSCYKDWIRGKCNSLNFSP